MTKKMTERWGRLKKGGSLGFALIIIVFGVVLLMLPVSEKPPPSVSTVVETAVADTFSLTETEARIAAALAQIEGAGEVTVVLTLKSDGETIIATDTRTMEKADETSERSESAVIVGSGGSVREPVIVGRSYPEFRGALVVCEGANDPEVRLRILGAVSSLTGLGTDKVTVAVMRRRN